MVLRFIEKSTIIISISLDNTLTNLYLLKDYIVILVKLDQIEA